MGACIRRFFPSLSYSKLSTQRLRSEYLDEYTSSLDEREHTETERAKALEERSEVLRRSLQATLRRPTGGGEPRPVGIADILAVKRILLDQRHTEHSLQLAMRELEQIMRERDLVQRERFKADKYVGQKEIAALIKKMSKLDRKSRVLDVEEDKEMMDASITLSATGDEVLPPGAAALDGVMRVGAETDDSWRDQIESMFEHAAVEAMPSVLTPAGPARPARAEEEKIPLQLQ